MGCIVVLREINGLDMEQIKQYLLLMHIINGGLALLTGPIAMFNQNGNRLHRLAGKIFFISMTVVFVSSVYLSIYENIPFLLMIGVFSYHSIAIGYRALYLKKLGNGQKAVTLDWFISITTTIFNICMLIWGINYYFLQQESFGIVAMAFGSIGLWGNYQVIKRYISGYQGKNGWLYIHISGMIGGYIAATTAFLVNVVTFQPSFVLWLAPTIVFTPVIIYTTSKFRKKLKKGKRLEELAIIKINV